MLAAGAAPEDLSVSEGLSDEEGLRVVETTLRLLGLGDAAVDLVVRVALSQIELRGRG